MRKLIFILSLILPMLSNAEHNPRSGPTTVGNCLIKCEINMSTRADANAPWERVSSQTFDFRTPALSAEACLRGSGGGTDPEPSPCGKKATELCREFSDDPNNAAYDFTKTVLFGGVLVRGSAGYDNPSRQSNECGN